MGAQVDYNLIRELLVYICESGYEQGAILVFLPGYVHTTRPMLTQQPPSHASQPSQTSLLRQLILDGLLMWSTGGTTSLGCAT